MCSSVYIHCLEWTILVLKAVYLFSGLPKSSKYSVLQAVLDSSSNQYVSVNYRLDRSLFVWNFFIKPIVLDQCFL